MDGTAEIEATRQQLMRIVALLLALAGLAERACRAPLPVRFLVLVFLRSAESVAREFVNGELPVRMPGDADFDGYDPACAARLGESFCALAVLLAGVAAGLGVTCEARIGVLRTGDAARVYVAGPVVLEPQPVDTS